MYSFHDSLVLNCIHRSVSAYGRIGEYINITATTTSLTLSVINSSLTVISRLKIPRPLFNGPGCHKKVHIKARAIDLVFKSVEPDNTSVVSFSFLTEPSGQEVLELQFNYDTGLSKKFRIQCLKTAVPSLDFQLSLGTVFNFECLPSMLRNAFASCEQGADVVKILFQRSKVNLHARKSIQSLKKASENSALRMGLKTIINLEPEFFRRITIETPWQAEIKLKELRIMLTFFDQIGEDVPLRATFNRSGPTTPMIFQARMTSHPDIEFSFKFITRITSPKLNEAPSWLRVGPQESIDHEPTSTSRIHTRRDSSGIQLASYDKPRRNVHRSTSIVRASNFGYSEDLELETASANHSRNQLRRTDNNGTDESATESGTETDGENDVTNTENDEENESQENIVEIGYTQDVPFSKGLFD